MNRSSAADLRGESKDGVSSNDSADIRVSFHGRIVLFHPISDAARSWLEEHCPADGAHSYWCGALVVEPRYVEDLALCAHDDGLSLMAGDYVRSGKPSGRKEAA